MAASETSRDHLTIKLEPALRRRIEAKAALRGRTVREYVEETLAQAVLTDAPVADVDARDRAANAIHVPPKTEEERARDLEAIAEVRRMRLELAERHGRFEPEGWVLINEARKERTRQLMEASGMEWTEEDEAAWDSEE